MNLKDALLKKARDNELGHFYIVDGDGEKFIHEFIRDYYQQIEGQKNSLAHLMDHPDVFVLGNLSDTNAPEESDFKVEEAAELNRFFEYKAVQSRRKFAVITEAHRIKPLVANNWLKLLEEPQGISTIFLLNPRRQKLLDTIHSRAIHLRIFSNDRVISDQADWHEFLNSIKGVGLAQFLEIHQKGEIDLSQRVNELVIWEAEQSTLSPSKPALNDWLKTYLEMETFNQPAATKWTLFYSHLQQHVLPRI